MDLLYEEQFRPKTYLYTDSYLAGPIRFDTDMAPF